MGEKEVVICGENDSDIKEIRIRRCEDRKFCVVKIMKDEKNVIVIPPTLSTNSNLSMNKREENGERSI